ncbi:MAG: fibronectin type III domain-containing protein [Desulfobacteraceae bacterium]|nr:fibronectin type III domain-containing protein [Desulfobacteraceae bacterium]
MARFPLKEAEIAALAEAMITGLTDNAVLYPAPPVAVLDLTAAKTAYITALNAAIAAKAAAEAATTDKDDVLDDLIDAMKSDIRYAENTVDYDDDKLKLIGWAGKAAATPLAVPGQVRSLEVPKQGAGWLMLDWKAPADGGAPNAYKVTRRERPAGAWEDVATAVITEATLVEQPTGKELEYRIIAVNKAGEGKPNNTVMMVL